MFEWIPVVGKRRLVRRILHAEEPSMRLPLRAVAGIFVVFTSAASGQAITSYVTINQPAEKGEPDKIVCKKEEQIGTRLGTKKLCLTVSEWNQRALAGRAEAERLQMGVCVPGAGCAEEGPGEPF
jgi:hypothetical protein